MNKKISTIALSLVFLASSSFTALAGPFPDVSDYHEYANEIQYLLDNGIAGGFSDGTFKPENTITRAEFTKIVVNAEYSESLINNCIQSNSNIFPDIASDHTFASFICMAEKNDIVKGYSDGYFKPDNTVTFGEASKIAMRTLDSSHGISEDADLTAYMNRLVAMGAQPPTISEGNKDVAITRGEAAFLIQIIRDNYTKLPDEPEAPSSEFMIKPYGTASVPEKGLSFSVNNFGIHCTTSQTAFIDLTVTKDGQSQSIHLERSCTGLKNGVVQGESTIEADAFGYHFTLYEIIERVAWDINSFEYYVRIE
ncbi:S-layer homology domain-containing protein [Candidatus Dojkabacteria bacterium]|uniref:S-layer homology domain-containing protein n=1 Tax=Candidatus Dojkabacteria bacterium TaxID=2099670 RepID=A0A955RL94_9BACT|nr:S-layer homology domain-containing protein [Candidatus Dojkabacteria bacterium]